MWLVVAAAAAVALVLAVLRDVRRAPGEPPRLDWLTPAGLLLLASAGIVGQRRRVLHATLLAASIALILASLILFVRGGAG